MATSEIIKPETVFRPIVIGALYTGIERGLTADTIAVRALDGIALATCTTIVVASHGVVSEVLDVPSDTVDTQLQHIFKYSVPNAAKIGIIGNKSTAEIVFRRLEQSLDGPIVFDMTLSGPSGEDFAAPSTLEVIKNRFGIPDLVTLRRIDAELLTNMEIGSLDDAQVAVQRIARLGARSLLLRCGRLPNRFFDTHSEPGDLIYDILFDGREFSLFEAPYVHNVQSHGASSALTMALLMRMKDGAALIEALQYAKTHVTEALRQKENQAITVAPDYFWRLRRDR